MSRPQLSVVVVAYDMARQLERTLATLAPGAQRGIEADDYEVIVVDNGSPEPVAAIDLSWFPGQLDVRRVDPAPPSPARAANEGIAAARAELVGLVVDGARMASPGLLAGAREAARLADHPVISTLGWHLGPVRHMDASTAGFDEAAQDELLAGLGWQDDGYRLFDAATLGGSSAWGWFQPLSESSALFLPRSLWEALGGLDERFALPGGGLVNHDLYRRACDRPETTLLTLLGEGTFHQLHGGSATSGHRRWEDLLVDYEQVKGAAYPTPEAVGLLVGRVPPAVLAHVEESARLGAERDAQLAARRARRLGEGG